MARANRNGSSWTGAGRGAAASLLLAAVFSAPLAAPAHAQALTPAILEKMIPLYNAMQRPAEPGAIMLPGAGPATPDTEVWTQAMGSRNIRNISRPALIPVLPDPAKATGTAVIVAPGGGFTALMIDNEGYAVARWLAERGIAAFVLKYRLNLTPADPAVYRQTLIQQLSGLANDRIKSSLATPAFALQDAQDAVRTVRQRAGEWGVNPQRIGFIGFSAGALTTMSVGLTPDKDARPDFIGPIYGSMERQVVPADAPPMFAALAADDALFGKSDLGLISAWREAKRPYELHIYERGGHGFGMRQQGATSDLWIEQFLAWMQARKLVPAAK